MAAPMSERITRSMARTGQTPGPAPKTAGAAPRAAFADLSNAAAQVVEEPLAPAAEEQAEDQAPPTPVMAMPSPSQAAAPTPTGLGLSSMPPLTPIAAGPARATEPNPTPMQGVPATSSKAQAAIQAAINALQGGSDDDDAAAIACSPLSGEEEGEDEVTLEDLLGTPLSELYPPTAVKAAPAAPACPPTEPAAAAAAAPAVVRSAIVFPSPSTFDPRSLNHLKREVKGRLEAAAAAAAGAAAAEEGEEVEEGELVAEPAAAKKVFKIQVDATGEGLAAALGGLSLRGVASPRGRHTRFGEDGEGEGVSRNGLGKHIYFDD